MDPINGAGNGCGCGCDLGDKSMKSFGYLFLR